MIRRLLLGPRKLTVFHHIALITVLSLFVFGFGGVTIDNAGAVMLIYALGVIWHWLFNALADKLTHKH